MVKEVAIVQNANIPRAVREVVSKVGLPKVKGKRVLIKPNCNSPDKFPGTTNPAVVVEVIKLCQEAGAKEVVVGDKSSIFWPHCRTPKVMKVIGLWDAALATGAKILPFDEGEWVRVKPEKAAHWPQGFRVPKILTEAEVIISVPVIHTHGMAGVSLSLKNSVGLLPAIDRMKMHLARDFQQKIAEINLAYEVGLVVLDGSKAFVDQGPNKGTVVQPNTIVASHSRVQADLAAYQLLVDWGAKLPLPPESHPQIAQALKIGVE